MTNIVTYTSKYSQFWNFRNLLPPRFSVNLISGSLEVQKLPLFRFRGSKFWFVIDFSIFWRLKFTHIKNSKSLKLQKWHFLELLHSPKLNSRNNWVTENAEFSTLWSNTVGNTYKSEVFLHKTPFWIFYEYLKRF